MLTSKRFYLLISLLLLALVLAGCGSEPTEVAEQEGGFLLALPRVTIDMDTDGYPSIAGIDAATLKNLTLGQVDLRGYRMDPAYVNWFTESDLQHLVLVHKDDGLYIFANNNPLPHIGWSGDALQSTGALAGDIGLLDPRVAKGITIAAPFLQRVGVDVAVRFPVGADQEIIEMVTPTEALSAVSDAGDENSLAVVRTHMTFDEEGVPTVLGVSTKNLEEAFGMDLRQAQLPPETVQMMTDSGIQHIMARTTDDGLLLFVNGEALPHLAWGETLLQNGADLYGQLYFTDEFALSRQGVDTLLPLLNNLDGEVVLLFPAAAGAEAIPLPNP